MKHWTNHIMIKIKKILRKLLLEAWRGAFFQGTCRPNPKDNKADNALIVIKTNDKHEWI